MKITFHGGAGSVTGACHLIETKTTKILVDCGLIQGGRVAEKENYKPFPFDPKEIDYVFVTHSHLDHTGRLPKLYKDGFRGLVFSTCPTKDLAELILFDSQHILSNEAIKLKRNPLYTEDDVRGILEKFKAINYDEEVKINENVTFKLQDAGHVLGSSIIELWLEGKKIVFSGDLGNAVSPILRPMSLIKKADYVIMESLYGDKLHEGAKERKDLLEQAIEDTVTKGGVLMIPAFAIERTQEILYELNELVENKRIPQIPIFLDSPLSIEATAVYKRYPKLYSKKAKELIKSGDALFDFPGLNLTRTRQESISINAVNPPKVIIAGSGMMQGGRIHHHLRRYLEDPKSMLLVISYQAPGSLGRKLVSGYSNVKIFNDKITVRAVVREIRGYSAHADQAQLFKFIKSMKGTVKKVFAVQGEEDVSNEFVGIIKDRLGIQAVVPKVGDSFDLV